MEKEKHSELKRRYTRKMKEGNGTKMRRKEGRKKELQGGKYKENEEKYKGRRK